MKSRAWLFFLTLLLLSCHSMPKLNQSAMINTELGLAYLKQGNRVRAKHKLVTALTLAPDSPITNGAMAYLMEQTGDKVQAEAYYKKAIALAPRDGAQFNNYGAFLCRQGQYRKAEAYFLNAVNDAHYENTASAYENAGLCALLIPNKAKAKHYFIKALQQDPTRHQSLYELDRLTK